MRLGCNWHSKLTFMTSAHSQPRFNPTSRCDSIATGAGLLRFVRRAAPLLPKVLRSFQKITLRHLSLILCLLGTAWAGVGGSISGTIKDPSGAAIAKATVTLVNVNTGVSQTTTADGRGAYTFPVLPVGSYVHRSEPARLPALSPLRNCARHKWRASTRCCASCRRRSDAVTVSDSAVHVETYQQPDGRGHQQ